MSKAKGPIWFRKFAKQEKSNCRQAAVQKELKKAIKKKSGITSDIINKVLVCSSNFIGCYAENEVQSLCFGSLPCFLVVNLDSSNMNGSHWMAIGIYKKKIEIFDSLGFDIFNWPRVPEKLIAFLRKMSISKRIKVSKRLQSNDSSICGLYSIFYVKYRPYFSFSFLQTLFTTNLSSNDSFVIKLCV